MFKDQLQKELNAARKAGDHLKRSVLGMVITAVKNQELAKRSQLSKAVNDPAALAKQSALDEAETQAVIAGEAKKRREAMEQFTAGGRPELAAKEKQELEILQRYLPVQLSADEVRQAVRAAIAQTGIKASKQMGQVIGQVTGQLRGQADGGMVSRIVKEELNQ